MYCRFFKTSIEFQKTSFCVKIRRSNRNFEYTFAYDLYLGSN